jgi:glycosyltransferase involved in cell wall biosynthesis
MVKISEYMAIGRPMVSFDLMESRRAAGAGALYAEDVEGFAALVDELLDDPARREVMGAAGRVRAEQLLAWEHQERSLLAAYERALNMGPAGGGALRKLVLQTSSG